MKRPAWLERIGGLRSAILEEVQACDERYRDQYFRLIVEKALREDAGSTILTPTASSPLPALRPAELSRFPKFQAFADRIGIGLDGLAKLLDLETGAILVTSLGSSNSEIQRRIAALLAARAAAAEGTFKVSRDLLKSQCQTFSAYDTNNFAAYMKKAEFNGSKVFIEKGDDWEVSTPGLAWVEDVLKTLLAGRTASLQVQEAQR